MLGACGHYLPHSPAISPLSDIGTTAFPFWQRAGKNSAGRKFCGLTYTQ